MQVRSRAASLALVSAIGLTALKVGVAYFTGSVGVAAEAAHSSLDLVSALVAFYTVREAGRPADAEHPFGHGKIETLSSLFEALLLWVAAGYMVYEGIDHFRHPVPLVGEWWAVGAMVVALAVSYWVFRHNMAASVKTESSALRTNALHFLTDVVASIGVLVGLLLIAITGWSWIDPFIAFGVALYIVVASYKQVKHAVDELTDTRLPADEFKRVRELIKELQHRYVGIHDLRTRRSGSARHVDFHVAVCQHLTVAQGHSVSEELEQALVREFPGLSVVVHIDPCTSQPGTGCKEASKEGCRYEP